MAPTQAVVTDDAVLDQPIVSTTSLVEPDRPDVLAAPADGTYLKAIEAFGEVAAAIGELRDLDGLLHLIAEKTCDLVGVRRCSLYLRDEASGLYRGQVGHWHKDIDQRVKRLISGVQADRFTAQILETKKPVVVQDTMADSRPIKSTMREWHVRSMLGVPMLVRDEVIGIIYLDDENCPRSYDERDAATAAAFADLAAVAISHAQLTAELRERLTTVQRQNRAMRRAAAIEDRLTTLAVDGCTVQEIAEAVAELTCKSVSIHDSAHRRIAAAGAPGSDPDLLPRLLEAEVRDHPRVLEALEASAAGKPTVVGPLLDAGLHRRSLVVPVEVRGDSWGSLVIAEHQARLTSVDMQIGRRAATIVAWEMGAQRRAFAAEGTARSSFVAELLRGSRDRGGLERRAEYLGVDLRRPHVVCLLGYAEGEVRPDDDRIADAFASDGYDVFVADANDGAAVILGLPPHHPDDADLKRLVVGACAKLSPAGTLSAGLSDVCRGAEEFPPAYEHARQVLDCVRVLCGPSESVLTARELGPSRVLFARSDAAEISRFARETLGPLLDGGASEERLLRTLGAFMEHGRSVRDTSVALELHENTIRYRLARIHELTGLDVLADAGAQLNAQLAMTAVRLRGGT